MSILVDAGPHTLSWQYREDGDAADPGTTTIGIVDGNGDVVVAAGTATSGTGTDPRTYSLAAIDNPTELLATWTYSGGTITDRISVVGGWLFTESQARTFDNAVLAATGTVVPSDAAIAEERDAIAADLERWTGRSWIPRYCRVEADGTGTRELWLDKGIARTADGRKLTCPGRATDTIELLSVTVNGTSVSTANVAVLDGVLWRTDSTWTEATDSARFNVVVEFVYGVEPGTNGSDRIALTLLRDRLVPSNISDRASSFSDELGTYRFVTAGFGSNVTSIPEVNAWVQANDRRLLVT